MSLEKALIINDLKSVKSVSLMDSLEKCEASGEWKYDYIVLSNAFKIWKDDSCYNVSLYFGRHCLGNACVPDDMSFTQLKNTVFNKQHFEKNRGDYRLVDEAYRGLDTVLSDEDNDCDEYIFETPIRFRAQSSDNRTGYSPTGNQFGGTNDYAFIGAEYTLFFKL